MWALWLYCMSAKAETMMRLGGRAAANQPVQDRHGPGARLTWLDPDGDEYICHGWVA